MSEKEDFKSLFDILYYDVNFNPTLEKLYIKLNYSYLSFISIILLTTLQIIYVLSIYITLPIIVTFQATRIITHYIPDHHLKLLYPKYNILFFIFLTYITWLYYVKDWSKKR